MVGINDLVGVVVIKQLFEDLKETLWVLVQQLRGEAFIRQEGHDVDGVVAPSQLVKRALWVVGTFQQQTNKPQDFVPDVGARVFNSDFGFSIALKLGFS